jgi:hypothetical protein
VHVPISDAPRRPRGHRYAGSRTDEQLARRTPRSVRLALTRATETALMPRLAGRHQHSQDAFHRVATDRVAPLVDALGAVWFERASSFTHRSHLGAAAACVSTAWGELLGQRRSTDLPCGSSCGATRDASDRLLPSHVLRTSTRASSALDASERLRACAIEEIACFTFRTIRFGGSHMSCRSRRGGRCLPAVTCANRTSDTPVASLTMATPLARA